MKAEIAVILGKRGSGKTTLARRLIEKHKSRRVIVIDTLGEYGEGRKIISSAADLIKAVRADEFNIAVRFEDAEEGFNWACRAAYAVRDVLFVCEEADFYIKANYAPLPFSMLVRYGRHRGVAMLCISRRPPDLWRNLTANADYIFAFRTIEPRDVKYLEEFMGESAAKLKSLKPYHYVSYNNGEVKDGKS